MGALKKFLQFILPKPTPKPIERPPHSNHGQKHPYKGLKPSEVFDLIYRNGAWGKDSAGNSISGSGSHNNRLKNPYIKTVKEILQRNDLKVIADLGCGDFNVGKHFVEDCERYIACDISNVILDRNRKNFTLDKVEFHNIDIADDELPSGDIAFVRQVLQHMSNDDIMRFLNKIRNTSPYKFLLVTEHLPSGGGFPANLDKPAGPNIRAAMNSGIELHKAPFYLRAKAAEVVLEVSEVQGGRADAIIRSTLYEF